MSAWKRVPPELARRFETALPAAKGVARRQMFGCPCAFVHGNMFAGLHEDRLVVRLPDEAAARPCVIMGRTMRQYALIEDALALTPRAMARWIERGYAFTRTLPPKPAKPERSARREKWHALRLKSAAQMAGHPVAVGALLQRGRVGAA